MDKKIRESIEACRPASDDLLADDMADVARRVNEDPQARLIRQRVEQWDAAIGQSIEDVPVPPGLAERILERLEAARPDEAAQGADRLLAASVSAASQTVPHTGETHVVRSRGAAAWSRRRWAGAVTVALLACVLVVVVGNWLNRDSQLPLETLAEQWREQLGNNWEQMARAPKDFAVPEDVLVMPKRWQWVDQFTTVPVAAYQLAHAKAGEAMLYVARLKRDGLPSAPPLRPQSNTGGRAVAYWQSGDRVYVLVVEDERSYRAFVRPSTPTLT